MRASYRILSLLGFVAAALIVAYLLGPIPQDPAYHDFADSRALLGVRNFWNVATNAPFLLVGVAGIALSSRLAKPELRLHYFVFCAAVALVAFGSAWYHLAPSNAALVWDRLPMTVAFMALLAAVLADRVSWLVGRALLWPLVVLGIASIAWWVRTEVAGHGDLRAYGVVQFLPMLLVPAILLLEPEGGIGARRLWMALGGYLAAKLAEHFDAAVMQATGWLGGHALKHIFAALAAWWIVRAFQGGPARAL
jgi:Ceramidase